MSTNEKIALIYNIVFVALKLVSVEFRIRQNHTTKLRGHLYYSQKREGQKKSPVEKK